MQQGAPKSTCDIGLPTKNREGEGRVAIENSKGGGGEGEKADRFRPHTHGYNASNNMFVAINV